jgi:hypothetical protein
MEQIKDLLAGVLRELQDPEKLKRGKLINAWPSIAGPKLAPHTKPVLSERGDLFVWVDQSSLAYEINQKYRVSLLKRTQAVLGEEAVKAIRVKVGQLR